MIARNRKSTGKTFFLLSVILLTAVTLPFVINGMAAENIEEALTEDTRMTYQAEDATFEMSNYTFLFDRQTGRYSLTTSGQTRISAAYASVKVGDTFYNSMDYTDREVTSEALADDFGSGILLRVVNTGEGRPTLEQTFRLYEGLRYFLTDTRVYWENGETIGTNYIAPLTIDAVGGVENVPDGKNYFLRVPYDNDGWVKFELKSVNGSDTGYEVAAILDEDSGKALVMGSLSHDIWKTGIRYTGSKNQINELLLYGGATGTLTRDGSPHGTVSGESVSSPLMFVGFYDDWQVGMEEFATANTVVTPPKTDGGSVPFGWNSWGAVQSDINLNTANKISDYIAKNLQDSWKTSEGDVVYVVLDSYWDNLSDTQLKSFVKHCKENGQEAGIYWAPFVSWHSKEGLASSTVEGSNGVRYQDIILKKADGSYYGNDLDGAFPIDMTHPAAQARVDYFIDRFKAAGFTYIKLDFLVHGALEGSRYDPAIQTGTQAYNFGMQYVVDRLDGQMFINLSIAPTFPYQYANGKRIACDAYYSISDTEYTLNGLTYGFWQKILYQYPDPDHIVIWGKDGGASAQEARSRITSGILLGTSFLTGDNFVSPQGKASAADERFKKLLTNPDILEIAKTGKIFHPAGVSHTSSAANLFVMTDGDVSYLAVFNYSGSTTRTEINLAELFDLPEGYSVKGLWSGEYAKVQDDVLSVRLFAKDAEVYRIGIADEPANPDGADESGTSEDPAPPVTDESADGEPGGTRNPAFLIAGIAGAAALTAASIVTAVLIRKKRRK